MSNASTPAVNTRLQAIQELVKALATKYATPSAIIKESTGIGARVTQPIPKDTVLLVIPGGECINYENVVSSTTATRGGGGHDNTIRLTTTDDGTDNSKKTVLLADVLHQIEDRCKQVVEGVHVEDVMLMVIIMYLVAQQKGTPSSSLDLSNRPNGPAQPCCHHLVPATWPSPQDVEAHFEWTDDNLVQEELQATYVESLFTLKRNSRVQIVKQVLLPILDRQFHVLHHFCATTTTSVTTSTSSTSSLSHDSNVVNDTPPTDALRRTALWNTFSYAYHLTQSRCHDGNRSADLIPLIDMLNGLPASSVDLNIHLECNPWIAIVKKIGVDDGAVPPEQHPPPPLCHPDLIGIAIYALQDLAANEELFISYGDVAPAPVLHKYGIIPHQYLTEPHVPADVVYLGFPPSLAPRVRDTARIQGLARHGYPTTRRAIEESFWFTLGPDALKQWQLPLYGGWGQDTPSYQMGEPEEFRNMRQYIIVAWLSSDEDIAHFVATDRVQGVFTLQDIGRYMVQVIDYNLGRLTNSDVTNAAELENCKTNMDMDDHHQRTATWARVTYRDALAQWRHVLCRYYKVRSAADDSPVLRDLMNLDGTNIGPHPVCLNGGGCSVCGTTLHIQRCARCRQVWYCSKTHQKSAWKFHKPICVPIDTQQQLVS